MKPVITRILSLRNRYFFFSDAILLAFVPVLALALRLDGFARLLEFSVPLLAYTFLSLALKLAVFIPLGLYQRFWRYASIEELILILKAIFFAGLLNIGIFFLIHPALALPRSLPFIDPLLSVIVVAAPRFSLRLLARYRTSFTSPQLRTLVVGAGDAGQFLAREMRQNPTLGFDLVGFVDDDPAKQGLNLRGVTIMGGTKRLPALIRDHDIQQVIIAIPSAPGRVIREIVDLCSQTGVKTRILPGLAEMLNGDVSLQRLRPVEITDLLRRSAVRTDTAAVAELIKGKRVLITGAGGSIGSELSRQIWRYRPSEIILLGHGENSIFTIYNELCGLSPGISLAGRLTFPRLVPVIADIRFADRMQAIFAQYHPQIVFHAAAHKHVPLMEMNPPEAITNNVLGTHNLLEASLATGVERFVMISTDKAVNPTSIMGASKRAAELLVHRAARGSGRAYVAVRFGNVLGSRGSVVRTFQQQIKYGGPVTVTHEEMKRYFMTIPEAVQLVLQASVLGRGGEVFVLDMGKPIKIVDLAKDLIELSGLRLGEDITIEITGMRPGEKLFEELFVPGEHYERTRHEKIFIVANASSLVPDDLDERLLDLATAANHDDKDAIFLGLKHLIPEFTPAGESPVEVSHSQNEGGASTSAPSPPPQLHPRPAT